MSPRLACRDDVLVTPVWNGPRYVSRGGSIIDFTQQHIDVPLATAELRVEAYRDLIAEWPNARVLPRLTEWCLQLIDAIEDCKTQRRAQGHCDVYAPDRPRQVKA